jgi:hypothetical protein
MLPTKLFHYSSKPIEKLYQEFHEYHGTSELMTCKPDGFWVSVEDYKEDQTWKTWCEAEKIDLEKLRYRYLVKIKEGANILHLETSEHIIDFGVKYLANDQKDFDKFVKRRGGRPYLYIYHIKWHEVMKFWDGIIIAPYDWECRMLSETNWYDAWDCASGCLWNISAIESLIIDSMPNL